VTRACTVRRRSAESLELSAEECEAPAAAAADLVRIAVERSVLDLRHLERMCGRGPHGADAIEPEWCSLLGRVETVGPGATGLAPGARVAAVGRPSDRVAVAAERCVVLPERLDVAAGAHWALIHALLEVVRRTPIRLGESVLVHGGGLTGFLLGQLARAAGATVCEHERGAIGSPPGGGVDVLVDTSGGDEGLAALLSAVRTGGRAILVEGPDRLDLDLYPDLHRRSLSLRACDLRAPGGRGERDVEFLAHLLDGGRLVLPERTCTFSPADGKGVELSPRQTFGATVVWNGGSR
jgi:NADPH:quinone reductase-like Zn-dependent oxidoreductase